MEKNKKIMFMIFLIIVFLIIIILILCDYKEKKNKKITDNSVINNQVTDLDEEGSNNSIKEQLDGKPVSITYENQTKEYKIEGTEHTINVNQSYAKVVSEDETIKQNLQDELDKIADQEFEDYKSKVENQIYGEFPISADFMEYVGNLSLGWNFKNSRIDKGIISIKNESTGSLGGASWEDKRGYSFSPLTGKRLNVEDLSADGKDLKAFVNSELRSYLRENSQRLRLDEETMSNFDKKVNVDNLTWYLSEDGFTVCFGKYQVSSDAFEYTIPYENLKDYMQLLPVSLKNE